MVINDEEQTVVYNILSYTYIYIYIMYMIYNIYNDKKKSY